MALGKLELDILAKLLPQFPNKSVSMVSVGYPDCLVPETAIADMFGQEIIAKLEFRDDAKDIIRWHSLEGQLDRVVETTSLFNALGIDLSVLDINEVRGGEIICDLNEPVADSLRCKFDIVLDAGTMEHCFNVGQTINNFVAAARVGGVIVHVNPLAVMNHGFFNFNPTFYYDFYVDNGHDLVGPIYGSVTQGFDYKMMELPPTERFLEAPTNSRIVVIARKRHDHKNSWPMQTKYKKSPTLGG